MVFQVSRVFLKIKQSLVLNLSDELESERIKADRMKHLQDRQLLNVIQELKLSEQESQQQQDDSEQDMSHQKCEYDEPTYISPQYVPHPEHFVAERFRYPGGMDYSNGGFTSGSSDDEDSVCSHATLKSTMSSRNLDRRSRRQRREQMLKQAYPRRDSMEGSSEFS
mmetsp:Transcript_29877/g.39110  ORF Transcript_29877/g.39110 Transcript_29877/m.39110 type:complete len:166 (+) Transcript_29877:77-574(+)